MSGVTRGANFQKLLTEEDEAKSEETKNKDDFAIEVDSSKDQVTNAS